MGAPADLASFAAVAFAPVAGGLISALVHHLPRGRSVAMLRSGRATCRPQLSAPDLARMVSFLLSRARASTAPHHLAAVAAAMAMAMWASAVEPASAMLWADCLLGWTLLALAWIDLVHMRLPDALTLPLLAFGLVVEAATASEQFASHAFGAMIGYAAFKGIAVGYRVARGRDGLGGGDAKLLTVAGAWLGWEALPDVVLLAALLGIAGALVGRALGRTIDAATALPFGPFLAIALWIVRLHGALLFGMREY